MRFQKVGLVLGGFFACCVLLQSARAGTATVVDWGGNYSSSSNVPFVRTASTTNEGAAPYFDSVRRLPFSDTDALVVPSATYAGTSAKFFGGYEAIDHRVKDYNSVVRARIVGSSPITDTIDYQIQPALNTTVTASFILMWLKPDFVDYSTAGGICLDADTTSIMVKMSALQGFAGRFLLREGSSYFISDVTFITSDAFTLTNPSTNALWAPFFPSASLNFDQTAPFASRTFTNVTGVGLYFENDAIPAGNPASVTAALSLTDFTVVASDTPVPQPPQPASVPLPSAACGGLLLMALAGLRRRRSLR